MALLLFRAYAAEPARQALVSRISVAKNDPVELEVETSRQVSPQAQLLSSPERLVIDVPGAAPGPTLHSFAVNRADVLQVRVGLLSKSPSITRIVLDLKQTQSYRLSSEPSGFRIHMGAEIDGKAAPVSADAQTIGWVLSEARLSGNAGRGGLPVVKAPSRPAQPALVNGVSVQFAHGLLSIHAANATLSEVLFQIQKQTGAEIAIPSGTEQQQVAADFGPGPASQVLNQLLDGSGLNFVVVGSEADPGKLRSVILSQKSEQVSSPESFTPTEMPPPASANIEPDGPPPAMDEGVPQPPGDPPPS